MMYDLVIVGGGASGFFCAIQCAERNPGLKILILEKSRELLSKVKISGGGRCNVTHACFDPKELVTYYPRGQKELLGPFHRFLCGDMMEWLQHHGVETKIEEDGRVFPVSNSSASIVNCYLDLCSKYGIEIITSAGVDQIACTSNHWQVSSGNGKYISKYLLLASGSSPATWSIIKKIGHTIIDPVPSLFTFNIKSKLLEGLAGISVPSAEINIKHHDLDDTGPLLITHWGLSGPAVLKLSSWGARLFNQLNYQFTIEVNWIGMDMEDINEEIRSIKEKNGRKKILSPLFNIPKRLWQRMARLLMIEDLNFADLSGAQVESLTELICKCEFRVQGKSTFKEEFVTAGGVHTKEINFKTMESRIFPGLFFTGEVINIDALTGGFNFQAAWTEAYIAAAHMVELTNTNK